jgi:hypothetical protein
VGYSIYAGGGWAMSALRLLATLSVESVSAAIAAVIIALFGFSLGSILGAVLAYFGIRAIIKSWILHHPLPSPMQIFLFVLALFGLIGGVQFIVLAAVLIAVFLIKEVKLKAPTFDGIIDSMKYAFLGIVMPIIGIFLPVVPFYEAAKKFRYDFIGAIALLLFAVVGVFIIYGMLFVAEPQDSGDVVDITGIRDVAGFVSIGGMFNDFFAGILGPVSPANPLLWVGITAYEELIGRPTAFANAMFTLLHMPSRLIFGFKATGSDFMAIALTFFILLIINFVTRWLWDTYQKHSIVASIMAHAFYNAGVGAFVELLEGNVLNFAIILFIGLVGLLYSIGRKLP